MQTIKKKGQLDISFILGILSGIAFGVAFLMWCLILVNTMTIENNFKCIKIQAVEGNSEAYCDCLTKSIKLSYDKELKQGYINLYNKSCGEYRK